MQVGLVRDSEQRSAPRAQLGAERSGELCPGHVGLAWRLDELAVGGAGAGSDCLTGRERALVGQHAGLQPTSAGDPPLARPTAITLASAVSLTVGWPGIATFTFCRSRSSRRWTGGTVRAS